MTDSIFNKEPDIVRVIDFRIDADYTLWIKELKQRYQSAQITAAIKVNTEKLRFNWSLGRDLVLRKAEEKWGSGVVNQLSLDLQEAFPNEKGFSVRNLWNMKAWYMYFSNPDSMVKLHQLGAVLQKQMTHSMIKLHQPDAEFDFPSILGLVPWRHQVNIISKCKSIDEAIFYIKESILGAWSRSTLDNALKANLYITQGKAISNFSDYLPETQSKLAQEITKDNYDFMILDLFQSRSIIRKNNLKPHLNIILPDFYLNSVLVSLSLDARKN